MKRLAWIMGATARVTLGVSLILTVVIGAAVLVGFAVGAVAGGAARAFCWFAGVC